MTCEKRWESFGPSTSVLLGAGAQIKAMKMLTGDKNVHTSKDVWEPGVAFGWLLLNSFFGHDHCQSDQITAISIIFPNAAVK